MMITQHGVDRGDPSVDGLLFLYRLPAATISTHSNLMYSMEHILSGSMADRLYNHFSALGTQA